MRREWWWDAMVDPMQPCKSEDDALLQVPPPDPFRMWGFCELRYLRMSDLKYLKFYKFLYHQNIFSLHVNFHAMFMLTSLIKTLKSTTTVCVCHILTIRTRVLYSKNLYSGFCGTGDNIFFIPNIRETTHCASHTIQKPKKKCHLHLRPKKQVNPLL
jgi:hypothetical protein